MSNTTRRNVTPSLRFAPKLTPYQLGFTAGRSGQGLRGLPYGPGDRQASYVQGWFDAVRREGGVFPVTPRGDHEPVWP